MYLNKVMLIGRLGVKPEVRYVKEDTPVATFRMATTEVYRSKEGERRENTEWHNIVAWRSAAKLCENYLDKGMLVYVEGRLQTRSWQGSDNATHYTTEILADTIRILESKASRGEQSANVQQPQNNFSATTPPIPQTSAAEFKDQPISTPQTIATNTPNASPFAATPEDDDLPF